jgi:iron complex transport system ATP-binding protein
MTGPALQLEQVTASLGGRLVLHAIDWTVPAGCFVCVVGPNGAGKSTLLRAAAGLIPSQGTIRLGGEPLAGLGPSARARRAAYLPQDGGIGWPLPVRDVIALGRMPRGARLGSLSQADVAAVAAAMRRMDVDHLADRPATELSGGERARVLMARALAVEAALLLADEPAAALDPRHQLAIMAELRAEARAGRTVVAVLHDLALAARFADRIAVVADGCLVADGEPAAVLQPGLLDRVFRISAIVETRDGQPLIVPWIGLVDD